MILWTESGGGHAEIAHLESTVHTFVEVVWKVLTTSTFALPTISRVSKCRVLAHWVAHVVEHVLLPVMVLIIKVVVVFTVVVLIIEVVVVFTEVIITIEILATGIAETMPAYTAAL